MKQPIITKEQLIKENAEMMAKINGLLTLDEVQRIEFAKAFGWTSKDYYDRAMNQVAKPSWAQIFVELGRLMANRNFRKYEGNINDLENMVRKLQENAQENNPAA